jgi:TetR/AcrR family transcriptional regulator, cholesterol catabolism regulator
MSDARRTTPRLKPGVKRAQILEVAAEQFGRHGYEETKWADVAESVGIGSTALYHYFESKQHCLFEIMAKAIAEFREQFDRRVAEHDDWGAALVAVLQGGFDLNEWEILRLRVLTAEHARVAVHSSLPREETARATARANKRDLEFAWGAFLARGMEQGLVPERSPQLLTRAAIGLYNSVWVWYRPGGALELGDVARFYIARQLDVIGCDPKLAARWLAEAA